MKGRGYKANIIFCCFLSLSDLSNHKSPIEYIIHIQPLLLQIDGRDTYKYWYDQRIPIQNFRKSAYQIYKYAYQQVANMNTIKNTAGVFVKPLINIVTLH